MIYTYPAKMYNNVLKGGKDMMKIDEERQELILSNGRRVDMHSIDRFLVNLTEKDLDSYQISKRLFPKEAADDFDEINECKRRLFNDGVSEPFSVKINKIIEDCERAEIKLNELAKKSKEVEAKKSKEIEDFKEKMRDFIIEWGTFLKNIESSLNFSDEQIYQIESVSEILFNFDFDKLEISDDDTPF